MKRFICLLVIVTICQCALSQQWQSKFVSLSKNGKLIYKPDGKGNIIPDFSNVGYHHQRRSIPDVPIVTTLYPGDNDQQVIQDAIDELATRRKDENGFRGTILLKAGVYRIPGTLRIAASGIVIRGEGNQTRLIATGKGKRDLIHINGKGNPIEVKGTRVKIIDEFVPVGKTSFRVQSVKGYKAGDRVMLFRPGTKEWIHSIRMDQIERRDDSTKQWQPQEYDLHFERQITKIEGNRIWIDNPVMMEIDKNHGGGQIYKYEFNDRLAEVGIEKLQLESEYQSATDEDHGWVGIYFNRIENGWVDDVTAKHFGYSAVNLGMHAKNITVQHSRSLEAKSQITGSRRYSFNNDGQQNLIQHCFASEGRHDYITGARVCGPNVFYDCRAEKAYADIGPHHRWAVGTLYDNIITDGEINVQDRGNWGTGHGWAGVTQMLWNCKASKVAVQSPWASGKNYAIGVTG